MGNFTDYIRRQNVFHGTLSNFQQFNLAYTTGQMGFHFGTLEQAMNVISDNYGEPLSGSKLIEANLNIKNPLKLKDLGSWYGDDVIKMVNDILGSKLNPSANDRAIRRAIQDKGFDSVVYENNIEGDGVSYIVFDPSQIKIINIQSF